MTDKTWWESVKLEGEALVDKLKELIHEGNIRRIRIVHQGRTVAEFPMTAGVVGRRARAGGCGGRRRRRIAEGLLD